MMRRLSIAVIVTLLTFSASSFAQEAETDVLEKFEQYKRLYEVIKEASEDQPQMPHLAGQAFDLRGLGCKVGDSLEFETQTLFGELGGVRGTYLVGGQYVQIGPLFAGFAAGMELLCPLVGVENSVEGTLILLGACQFWNYPGKPFALVCRGTESNEP